MVGTVRRRSLVGRGPRLLFGALVPALLIPVIAVFHALSTPVDGTMSLEGQGMKISLVFRSPSRPNYCRCDLLETITIFSRKLFFFFELYNSPTEVYTALSLVPDLMLVCRQL